MSAKIFFRTFFFLLLLFVVIWISIANTQSIEFRLPLVLEKPVQASAAIVFFAVFAVGVLGGTLLNAGGDKQKGGGKEASSSSKKK